MTTPRFYLPPEAGCEETFTLAGREGYHAVRVLRVQPGDHITVLDGAGQSRQCEVQHAAKDSLLCRTVQRVQSPSPACALTLLVGVPKARLIENIIEKATELGAVCIVPLLTERTIMQLDAQDAEHKREKWQQIAIEAIKQCGQPWLPRVASPMPLDDCLKQLPPMEFSMVGDLQGETRHVRHWVEDFQQRQNRRPATAGVWIGPEGDFSPEELGAIRQSGARPVTFGSLVLRVETAAIYALSVLNHELNIMA